MSATQAIAITGLVLIVLMIAWEIHQEREDETRVEVEEIEQAFQWPPKWHPDPAETHLGKSHIGVRRGR